MSDPTRIRGFQNVSTSRQTVFITEGGEAKIRQISLRRWEVLPRGGEAYEVNGKQEAIEEARSIATGLTLSHLRELQKRQQLPLTHFPEMAPPILAVHEKLDDIARRAADEHDEAMCRSCDRKGYASMATRYPFATVMFRMLTDGASGVDAAKAIMRRQTLASLERLVYP